MKLLCNHTTWICSQSAVGVKKQSKVHKTAPAPVSKSMNYVTISRTSNCKFQHIRGDQMCNLHNIISPRVPIIYESCILSSWGDTHKSPPPLHPHFIPPLFQRVSLTYTPIPIKVQ